MLCQLLLSLQIKWDAKKISHPLIYMTEKKQYVLLDALRNAFDLTNDQKRAIILSRAIKKDTMFFAIIKDSLAVVMDDLVYDFLDEISDDILERLLFFDYFEEISIDLFVRCWRLNLSEHFNTLKEYFSGSMDDVYSIIKDFMMY